MNQPVIVERVFAVGSERLWKALTDNHEMKQWYFDLPEFDPVAGFEFQFYGGKDEANQYLHHCCITEVVPGKKLSYSWRYAGYEGSSLVTFELTEEPGGTRLKVTHSGLDTFPPIDDFARHNFETGWTAIVNQSLKQYLEKN